MGDLIDTFRRRSLILYRNDLTVILLEVNCDELNGRKYKRIMTIILSPTYGILENCGFALVLAQFHIQHLV